MLGGKHLVFRMSRGWQAGFVHFRPTVRRKQRPNLLHAPLYRHQSSYQRTRSRLNIKPDPSFLPSTNEPLDHIIHNAPPSLPNVYHTPAMFLPKGDPRRKLHEAAALQRVGLTDPSAATAKLPPPTGKPQAKRYHLTKEDMDEMRRLRREDPMEWSAKKLAKKFDCSSIFVSLVTEGIAKEKKELQKQVLATVKSEWGPRRRAAREDRALRKERWGLDR